MPFALVTIGLIMVVTGARDTHTQLASSIREDFIGPQSFLWWIAAIGAVGSLGYVKSLRPFSHAFMALILISMVLSNEGLFTKLTDALNKGPEEIDVAVNGDTASNLIGKQTESVSRQSQSVISSNNQSTAAENFSVLADGISKAAPFFL